MSLLKGRWKSVVLENSDFDDDPDVFLCGIEEFVVGDEASEIELSPDTAPSGKKKQKKKKGSKPPQVCNQTINESEPDTVDLKEDDSASQKHQSSATNGMTPLLVGAELQKGPTALEKQQGMDDSEAFHMSAHKQESKQDVIHNTSVKLKRKKSSETKKQSVSYAWDGTAPKPAKLTKDGEDQSEWDKCFVPELIMGNLSKMGFSAPTEIQREVLPAATAGKHDVIAAAETGSGKTLAYLIPAVRRIMDLKESNDKPKVLVIVPTRELAVQVLKQTQGLLKDTKIRHVLIVGGLASHKQIRLLSKKPDIIIGTPGRLWQLISEGNPHLQDLPAIRCLILDEADRLCESGYFKDLEKILNTIYDGSLEHSFRQTMVLSATLTVSRKIQPTAVSEQRTLNSILSKLQFKNPVKKVDLTTEKVTAVGVKEEKILCDKNDKDLMLYYLVTSLPGRKLVFFNAIDQAKRVYAMFTQFLRVGAYVLHANMQQRQRLKNLERFAQADNCCLLSTDISARGLDIRNVSHVIHYHLPHTFETYVHRSGRTARGAGSEGRSIIIMSPDEAKLFVKISSALSKTAGDIKNYEVDQAVLRLYRRRVKLATAIESLNFQTKKKTRDNSFIEQAAKDLDVDVDEYDSLIKPVDPNDEHRLQALKAELKQLLDAPITGHSVHNIRNPLPYVNAPAIK